MTKYSVSILGNVQTRRTEAEVERVCPDGSCRLAALVFEDEEGWQTQLFEEPASDEDREQLEAAVTGARKSLRDYVNRLGKNCPEGLTVAGLSLWLMEKSDGTAMGRPYRK